MSGGGPERLTFYRPAEVAERLRCSEWWVKEQARRRRIPFCWIGGGYRFTEEHVATIARLCEVLPPGPAAVGSRAASPASPAVASGPSGPSGPPALLRARVPRRARKAAAQAAAA